ncbi:MAG: 6-bladed beta-propeller [Tannerella sp.]|jgi:hypothetical protein|nr:6-bladed beta-propeller [Tannerella sp.]
MKQSGKLKLNRLGKVEPEKREIFLYLSFFVIFLSCNLQNNKGQTDAGKETVHESSKEAVRDTNGIEDIAVFSGYEKYDNNLSTVADKIEFIQLSNEPPINDFLIYDVQVEENYIFLSDLYNIRQYDLQGNYIKNIGGRGMGPEEFIQLNPPLQLDRENKLIYAVDVERRRMPVYRYDGSFACAISLEKNAKSVALIDSTTIVIRQNMSERELPECPLIRFMNYEGEITKVYPSHLYPYSGEKINLGSMESFLWEVRGQLHYLEYGSDTVYQIVADSIIPVYRLTGKLKLKPYEFFSYEIGNRLNILAYILRPNSAIFESDCYMIFRLGNQRERLFMIYSKETKSFHRTYHKDAPVFHSRFRFGGDTKMMDYFIDDTVSGLHFNPQYQSMEKAIALIPATEVREKRDDILRFIASHPSDEGARLKAIVEAMDEFDNPVVMMVTFK